jgi:adenine-specific DNA methylase
METQSFIDIANNISIVLILIFAVWWFNKQLETVKQEAKQDLKNSTEKNEKLYERVSEMEKNYITTIERNTTVIERFTEAIEDLKDEIKKHQ